MEKYQTLLLRKSFILFLHMKTICLNFLTLQEFVKKSPLCSGN